MKPIDVVMVTWQREAIANLCLKSLYGNTKTPFRLIVIDNGSDPEFVKQRLFPVADVYVKLDKNIGLEAAKHLGMDFVESEWFVSTDNDILVPKKELFKTGDWLSNLVDLITRYPEYASIALRPQILVGTGDIFGDNPPEVREFSHVPGYMRLMETKLTNQLGAWSDKRELRGHEEYWISERIIKAGRKCGWASHIPCYHLFGNDGNWGYGSSLSPQQHGHNPTWLPQDDLEIIRRDYV